MMERTAAKMDDLPSELLTAIAGHLFEAYGDEDVPGAALVTDDSTTPWQRVYEMSPLYFGLYRARDLDGYHLPGASKAGDLAIRKSTIHRCKTRREGLYALATCSRVWYEACLPFLLNSIRLRSLVDMAEPSQLAKAALLEVVCGATEPSEWMRWQEHTRPTLSRHAQHLTGLSAVCIDRASNPLLEPLLDALPRGPGQLRQLSLVASNYAHCGQVSRCVNLRTIELWGQKESSTVSAFNLLEAARQLLHLRELSIYGGVAVTPRDVPNLEQPWAGKLERLVISTTWTGYQCHLEWVWALLMNVAPTLQVLQFHTHDVPPSMALPEDPGRPVEFPQLRFVAINATVHSWAIWTVLRGARRLEYLQLTGSFRGIGEGIVDIIQELVDQETIRVLDLGRHDCSPRVRSNLTRLMSLFAWRASIRG